MTDEFQIQKILRSKIIAQIEQYVTPEILQIFKRPAARLG